MTKTCLLAVLSLAGIAIGGELRLADKGEAHCVIVAQPGLMAEAPPKNIE